MSFHSLDQFLRDLQQYFIAEFGRTPTSVVVKFSDTKLSLPFPLATVRAEPPASAVDASSAPWLPTAFQQSILDALDGRALRADALGDEVGDRGRLYKKPGGIQELRDHGLVAHHPRRGYYRPDAPPPELEDDAAAH
jgi:hypothetical protein